MGVFILMIFLLGLMLRLKITR